MLAGQWHRRVHRAPALGFLSAVGLLGDISHLPLPPRPLSPDVQNERNEAFSDHSPIPSIHSASIHTHSISHTPYGKKKMVGPLCKPTGQHPLQLKTLLPYVPASAPRYEPNGHDCTYPQKSYTPTVVTMTGETAFAHLSAGEQVPKARYIPPAECNYPRQRGQIAPTARCTNTDIPGEDANFKSGFRALCTPVSGTLCGPSAQ